MFDATWTFIVSANLNTAVAVDLQSSEQRFQNHVLGLSYFDPVSGKSALLAEVKDCVGQLVAPNQIVWPDAFTDFRADYRLTLRRDGVEADVILREQPPSPELFGLSAQTAQLQVLTEFLNPPTLKAATAAVPASTNGVLNSFLVGPNLADEQLSFGSMAFERGRAFSLDESASAGDGLSEPEAPVGKSWQKLQGPNGELRDFLIESVNYFSISPQLERLPQPANRQASNQKPKTRRLAMSARELPVAPSGRSAEKSFTVARARSSEPGFAIDYNLVSSSTNNQTFQSDTTYYVSGTCTLSGVTTLEGGTVIKYTNNAELRISGVLNCQTAPYRLAILTSKDDDAVGESITGSTGNPSTNFAAGIALHFYVGYNFYSDLRHVRIAHAQTAIQYDAYTYDAGSPNRLAHAQLVHCQRGIVPNNKGFLLRNVLMKNVLTNFYNTGNASTGRVEHLTIDQANLMQGNTNITLYLTNSLLVGVSAYGTYSGAYNATGAVTDFVAVGGGWNYWPTPLGATRAQPTFIPNCWRI